MNINRVSIVRGISTLIFQNYVSSYKGKWFNILKTKITRFIVQNNFVSSKAYSAFHNIKH